MLCWEKGRKWSYDDSRVVARCWPELRRGIIVNLDVAEQRPHLRLFSLLLIVEWAPPPASRWYYAAGQMSGIRLMSDRDHTAHDCHLTMSPLVLWHAWCSFGCSWLFTAVATDCQSRCSDGFFWLLARSGSKTCSELVWADVPRFSGQSADL